MSSRKEKHSRLPDRPSAWKLHELRRECVLAVVLFVLTRFSCRIMAKWSDSYIKWKPADKLVKVESKGEAFDPCLLPINVASKGHWSAAEHAIAEASSMYIDRESLKAYGVSDNQTADTL